MTIAPTFASLDVARDQGRFPGANQAPGGANRRWRSWTALPRRRSHKSVIDAIEPYYETTNANIHRGVYDLSERATVSVRGLAPQGRSVHQCPVGA